MMARWRCDWSSLVACILAFYCVTQICCQPEVEWSDWSDWSNCTRPCGGGIIEKTRECIKLKNGTNDTCVGPSAIYKMCNIQDCPEGTVDFRMQQCSKYDKKPHKGKLYRWAGFHHTAGECELKCMPKKHFFYVTFAKKVIDGTKCNPYSPNVCINGTCIKVGCDKQLYSNAKEDICGVCNGNGGSCKPFSGEFEINQNAYGYLDITTIPVGATNIKVYETGVISSFIAVKRNGQFILNGARFVTEKTKTLLDGRLMEYEKTESKNELTIKGPITLPLKLYAFVLDGIAGNRIRYEYYIPKNTVPQIDRKPTYRWSTSSWSQCSKTCATGQRTRSTVCRNYDTGAEAKSFHCDKTKQPILVEDCNAVACPSEWYISQWSPCSKTCGEGTRTRRVNCIAIDKDGETSMLDFSQCKGNPAPRVEKCIEQDRCPQWKTGEWTKCSRTCGIGYERRTVTCTYTLNSNSVEEEKCSREKPIETRECFNVECGAVWVAGTWSQCSTHCGVGMRSRSIACKNPDGIEVPTSSCSKDDEPEHFKDCEVQGPCRPVWYSSQWSKCSGNCGNGLQMRNVYCVEISQNQMYMVNERTCNRKEKPKSLRQCEGVKPCHVNYFASKWSECSATCGMGVRVREVRCYADRRINYSGELCASLRKPSNHEICQLKPCENSRSVNTGEETLPGNVVKITQPDQPAERSIESPKSKATIVRFVGPDKLHYTDDADYSCIVAGNPRPIIQFLLNGELVSGSRFRVTKQSNGARLTILTAFTVDSGELKCIAANNVGVSSKSIQLEVIEPPKARVYPGSTVREEGGSFFISCHVKGKANRRVQWTKDGIPYQGDPTRVSVQERRIYIRKLIPADTGRYRCTAFNAAGSGTGEMQLTVNKKPEKTSETCFDTRREVDCASIRTYKFLCDYATYKKFCCASCNRFL